MFAFISLQLTETCVRVLVTDFKEAILHECAPMIKNKETESENMCEVYVLYVKYPHDFRITFWLQPLSKPCSVPSTLSDWSFLQRLDSSFLYSTLFCFSAGWLRSSHIQLRMSDCTFTQCTFEYPGKRCCGYYMPDAEWKCCHLGTHSVHTVLLCTSLQFSYQLSYSLYLQNNTPKKQKSLQNPTVQKSFLCVSIPQVFSCLVNIKVAMFISLEDLYVGVTCDVCSAWLFL